MEEEDLPSCLICSRSCSSMESLIEFIPGGTESKESKSNSACPQLELQLNVVFVLRKLLELPERTCADLISSHGNPSDWGQSFCLQCSGFIEEAQEVSHKITNYLEKFKCLQLKIHDELRYSYDENEVGKRGPNVNIRAEIRKLFVQDRDPSNSTKITSSIKSGTKAQRKSYKSSKKSKPTFGFNDETEADADSRIAFPTPVIVKIKTECTSENERDPSPEPSYNDSFNDSFQSDEDYLDPGSVVKVLSEENENSDISDGDTFKHRKRSLRSSSVKALKCRKLDNSQDDNLKSVKANKKGSLTNPIGAENKTETSSKSEYKCPLCPKVLLSVNFLNLHYKKIHLGITSAKDQSRKVLKKNQKKCSTSKDRVSSNSSSSRRDSRGERKYPFKCAMKDCLQYFPSKFFAEAHYKRKHQGIEKPFQCDKCHKAYERNACLVIHKKSCSGDGTFFPVDPKLQTTSKIKCPRCPRKFLTTIFMEAHVKRHHEGVERPYDCHLCEKSFQRHNGLNEHLRGYHEIKLDTFQTTSAVSSDNKRETIECSSSNDSKETTKETNRDEESSPVPDHGDGDDGGDPPDDADELCGNDSSEDENESLSKIAISPAKKKLKQQKVMDDIKDKDYNPEATMRTTRGRKSNPDTGLNTKPKKFKRKSLFPIKARELVTQIYRCSHEGCNRKFHLEVQLNGHQQQAHEGVLKPFKCDYDQCDKVYGRYSTLQIHKESAHGLNNDTYVCEQCGKSFHTPGSFKRHIYYVHERRGKRKPKELTNKHACDECGKLCKGPSGLLRHKQSHEDRIFQCSDCSLEFPTRLELNVHRRTTHLATTIEDTELQLQPQIKCSYCDKMYNTRFSLRQHEKLKHQEEFKFSCSVSDCGMKFLDRSAYDRHMLKHSGKKPYTCTTCGKGLTRSNDLNRHMRLHTGEKPFICEACGVGFSDSSKLTKHQKTHGPPGHSCEICSRKFYSFSGLRVHKKIHLPNHVGRRVKRPVDPDKPKQKRPRKPKNNDEPKIKKPGGPGRGRPRKVNVLKQESESQDDLEFETTEEYNSNGPGAGYVLDMHQPRPTGTISQVQPQQYQLPASSPYNIPPVAHQQLVGTSGLPTPVTSFQQQRQLEYQNIQGSQPQAIGLLTQTYNLDPTSMYFNHLIQMNPSNNNS